MIETQIKHRFQRCLEILNAIIFEKGVNRNILVERHKCSKRTIAKDIKLLKEIGFNIRYRDNEYSLLPSELQIPAVPLGKEHILSLFIGSQLLVLSPLEHQASIAVQNILLTMKPEEQAFLKRLTDRICISPGGEICAPEILFDVYRAVSECQLIRIYYQSLSQHREIVCNVKPYGIYIRDQYSSYMVGDSYGDLIGRHPFKLCRIRKLEFQGIAFVYPEKFSIREEISKGGFWSGDEKHHVLLKFIPAIAQLVREREPANRITEQVDGSLLVRKTVRQLKEVLWEILAYEANVEVLEPEELKQMVKKSIENMRQVYEQGLDMQKSL